MGTLQSQVCVITEGWNEDSPITDLCDGTVQHVTGLEWGLSNHKIM